MLSILIGGPFNEQQEEEDALIFISRFSDDFEILKFYYVFVGFDDEGNARHQYAGRDQ